MHQEMHARQSDTGMKRGAFISIEGGDGAGKTTQAALLVDALEAQGATVCRVHEPGGTELGERVRSILLDPSLEDVDALAELLLYEAARAQLVATVVVPALERGEVVVCDRFCDSTTAYQGYGRGLDVDMVERFNAAASRGIEPDCTLLLDMDSAFALDRAVHAGDGADRMEAAGQAFHDRVREGFRCLAESGAARVRVVDASGTPQQVHARVMDALVDALGPEFAGGAR